MMEDYALVQKLIGEPGASKRAALAICAMIGE
jgi:hypothetical protein